MQKHNNRLANLKLNKKLLIIIVIIVLLASCIITLTTQIVRRRQIKELEGKKLIEYNIKEIESDMETCKIVLKFNSIQGIETIKYKSPITNNEVELNCNGKMTVGVDYIAVDGFDYDFDIKLKDEPERTETLHFELPRIKGNYTEVDGLYANAPDLTGFVPENTRYMHANTEDKLVPGNWITDDQPENWYSYKNQKWANVYVESNGIDSYYVWIPRYVYKIDTDNSSTDNERMDVKFVDTNNKYTNAETGVTLEWSELKDMDYKLPEAFLWNNSKDEPLIIPGYWMSKYQLSELESYVLDYNLQASKTAFNVNNFKNNVGTNAIEYTYAINGQIEKRSGILEDYSFANTNPNGLNTINITALDSYGRIIGSMTKKFELAQANPPDLTGFDRDTTFYVYWDKDGNEHNEIPINQSPPEDWYNYSYSEWANIVTRNNGLESYYVWIPRYQYLLDRTSQRSNVQFILGDGPANISNYQVPEAFSWGDNNEKQLTGYWMSKYQLSDEAATSPITAEFSAGTNIIRVGDITGTNITANRGNIKYEYYINGSKVNEGISDTDRYVYTELADGMKLQKDTIYTINIIARNATTNAYIGAITKKVKTIAMYEPDLTGFDKDTTFYVIYNDDGTEKERISINNDAPDNWYDYSDRKWANIVTTANGTNSYFVWIPRYEYRLLSTQRSDISFITTDITNQNCTTGYKVPEAFSWGENGEVQLKGYWMSKYQLSQ